MAAIGSMQGATSGENEVTTMGFDASDAVQSAPESSAPGGAPTPPELADSYEEEPT
jgi:hypothetical protein